MSIECMQRVWKSSAATEAELLMLLAIADRANDQGHCWARTRELAHRARVQVRSIFRLINRTVEHGELYVKRNGDKGAPNHFLVLTGKTDDEIRADMLAFFRSSRNEIEAVLRNRHMQAKYNDLGSLPLDDDDDDDDGSLLAETGGDDLKSGGRGDDSIESGGPMTVLSQGGMTQLSQGITKLTQDQRKTHAQQKIRPAAPSNFHAGAKHIQLTQDEQLPIPVEPECTRTQDEQASVTLKLGFTPDNRKTVQAKIQVLSDVLPRWYAGDVIDLASEKDIDSLWATMITGMAGEMQLEGVLNSSGRPMTEKQAEVAAKSKATQLLKAAREKVGLIGGDQIYEAWATALGYTPDNVGRHKNDAKKLADNGYTVSEVIQCWRYKHDTANLRGPRFVSLGEVARDIKAWIAQGRPTKPATYNRGVLEPAKPAAPQEPGDWRWNSGRWWNLRDYAEGSNMYVTLMRSPRA